VSLAPGQTVFFEDLVASGFFTAGSGSLEVLGDVVVFSRTYARDLAGGGTLGSQVVPNFESVTRGDFPFFVAGLPFVPDRFNLGITEVAGGSGTIRVREGDRVTTVELAPFSHRQMAIGSSFAAIDVVAGDARVVSYLSQVDPRGDSMIVPALTAGARSVLAPAISATGATAKWQSDLWLTVPNPSFPFIIGLEYVADGVGGEPMFLDEVRQDVVAAGFGRPGTAGVISFSSSGEMFPHSRITNGLASQYVPFLPPSAATQHLAFIRNDSTFRTNLGIAAREAAVADAIVYDAAGIEIERHTLATPGGLAQVAVTKLVTGGRAVVRFREGAGVAYASVIDLRSGDATFVPYQ
jgi:hypothetical protein